MPIRASSSSRFTGKVVHKGTAYPGQHQAIVDAELFDTVQRQLAEGNVGNQPNGNTAACSLLAGTLIDAHGRTMSPSHTSKAGRRYRYYGSQTDGAAGHPAWRIGAHGIERVVCDAIAAALDAQLCQRLDRGDLANDAITQLRTAIAGAKHTLADIIGTARRDLLAGIVRRIDIAEDTVSIDCSWACIDPSLGEASDLVTAPLPLGCVRTRKQQRMLIAADDQRSADPATVRLIARAFAARKVLLEQPSIETAASSLGYSRDYIIALARLSYLAPDLVTAIVDDNISGVTGKGPLTRVLLPSDWDEQRACSRRCDRVLRIGRTGAVKAPLHSGRPTSRQTH